MVRRHVAGPASDLPNGKRVSAEDGRGLYTFTDTEMSICRSAQLSSYTGARAAECGAQHATANIIPCAC